MDTYELEKPVWSDEDFEIMGWHDSTVWGMLQNSDEWEYLLDLDYIFKWVNPEKGETYFKFWVAPVTMVFDNTSDVKIHLESSQGHVEIADLYMENPTESPNGKFINHTYRFDCHNGTISLRATGFKMFVRKTPILLERQSLELKERGGVNFGRKINIS
mgnify:CR=1 FL=1